MLSRVRNTLRQFGVKPGALLIVAVSGGPDSVCLFHVLSEIGKTYPFKLHAGHLNHSLRGQEADEDADFVKTLAGRLNVPATLVKKDVARLAGEAGRSKQETARIIRYQVLQEILEKQGAGWIVTAHHADDQAETFLMRVIRGAGSGGFSSIPGRRGNILRPFLHITREEILRYLENHRLPYREDSSNQSPVYFRNEVRRRLLPFLKEYNPNIVRVLGHEADILTEEDLALEEWADRILPAVADLTFQPRPRILLPAFMKQPPALQRRILRKMLYHVKGNLLNIHYDHIQSLLYLAGEGMSGKSVHLPGRLVIFKSYESLIFTDQNALASQQVVSRFLPVPGRTSSPELKVEVITSLVTGIPSPGGGSKQEVLFDFQKIRPPLELRTRRPGDFMYPVRLKGKRKKIQDLFVDCKIPGPQRNFIPLISGMGRVLWAVGVDHDFKSLVTSRTETTLRIEVNLLNNLT